MISITYERESVETIGRHNILLVFPPRESRHHTSFGGCAAQPAARCNLARMNGSLVQSSSRVLREPVASVNCYPTSRFI